MKDKWNSFYSYLILDRKLSDSTANKHALESRFRLLCDYLDNNNLEFNRSAFLSFIEYKKTNGAKNAYLNQFVKLMKHYDRFIGMGQLSDFTYFKEVPPEVDVLTPSDISRLAQVQVSYSRQSEEKNQYYQALIYFLALTGCRISEVTTLKWGQVYADRVAFLDTKNGENRLVPITPFLYNLLMNLPKKEYVFQKIHLTSVNHELRRRAKLCVF